MISIHLENLKHIQGNRFVLWRLSSIVLARTISIRDLLCFQPWSIYFVYRLKIYRSTLPNKNVLFIKSFDLLISHHGVLIIFSRWICIPEWMPDIFYPFTGHKISLASMIWQRSRTIWPIFYQQIFLKLAVIGDVDDVNRTLIDVIDSCLNSALFRERHDKWKIIHTQRTSTHSNFYSNWKH